MSEHQYVVATIKPWNIKLYEEHSPTWPGSWHLITDPGERREASANHPDVLREYLERLAAWGGGAAAATDRAMIDTAVREKLEALGYAGD